MPGPIRARTSRIAQEHKGGPWKPGAMQPKTALNALLADPQQLTLLFSCAFTDWCFLASRDLGAQEDQEEIDSDLWSRSLPCPELSRG